MIPSGYSRNTIYGHLTGGEIFQISLWAAEAPTDQGAAQTQANTLAAAFNTTITTPPTGGLAPTTFLGTPDGYDGVRVYSYTDTSGKAKYIGDASLGKPGTNSTGQFLPTQCAAVVTLRTAVAGRSATGRIYVPVMRVGTGTGGQLGSTDAAGIAKWWSGLITAWNNAVTPAKIGVLSQLHGTFQPITSVRVDSKVDIQRRRANKVQAQYSTITPVA